MYVCLYVSVYIRMYVTYVRTYVCMCVCMHACMYVYKYAQNMYVVCKYNTNACHVPLRNTLYIGDTYRKHNLICNAICWTMGQQGNVVRSKSHAKPSSFRTTKSHKKDGHSWHAEEEGKRLALRESTPYFQNPKPTCMSTPTSRPSAAPVNSEGTKRPAKLGSHGSTAPRSRIRDAWSRV